MRCPTYATEFVPLNIGLRFSATEASFVNEVWQLLRHQFLNLFDCRLEAILGLTCDMEVQRWRLRSVSSTSSEEVDAKLTFGVAMLLSG